MHQSILCSLFSTVYDLFKPLAKLVDGFYLLAAYMTFKTILYRLMGYDDWEDMYILQVYTECLTNLSL